MVGPAPAGLVVDSKGDLDERDSFRRIDYFDLLSKQHVRNNPEPTLDSNPIDFAIRRLPEAAVKRFDSAARQAYWISAGADRQLVVLSDGQDRIALRPVSHLLQNSEGAVAWHDQPWRAGLPLRILEDPALQLPSGADRAVWLSGWHSE